MVHPSRSAPYLISKFREWGVIGLDIVKVVNVLGLGRGLSALKKIFKSQIICSYTTLLTDERNPNDEIYQYQDVRTGEYASVADYLGVIQFGVLANHSFNEVGNNSIVRLRCHDGVWTAVLVATRDIEKNESICLDYGEEYWRNIVSNYILDPETELIVRQYLNKMYDEKMASLNRKRKH